MGSLVSLNVNTLGWAYHSIIFESDFLNTVSSTAVRSSPFGPFWKRLMKLCACAQGREGNGQRGVLLRRERSVCSIARLGRAHSKKTAKVPTPRSLNSSSMSLRTFASSCRLTSFGSGWSGCCHGCEIEMMGRLPRP